MGDFNEIGKKINRAVKTIKKTFTEKELEDFIEYIGEAEAIAPLITFQRWQELPSDACDEAKKRAELLLEIKKLKDY